MTGAQWEFVKKAVVIWGLLVVSALALIGAGTVGGWLGPQPMAVSVLCPDERWLFYAGPDDLPASEELQEALAACESGTTSSPWAPWASPFDGPAAR